MNCDYEIIQKLTPYLEKVQYKGNGINFRCPVCGDGKTAYKTRAWLVQDKSYYFHCFNCETTLSLSNLLKNYFPEIYNEFIFLSYKQKNKYEDVINKSDDVNLIETNKILNKYLIPSSKSKNVSDYICSRHALKFQENIFIVKDFKCLTEIPKYKNSKFVSEPRLVVPCYNNYGLINAIISRALLKNSKKRYLNLKFDNNHYLFNVFDSNGNYVLDLNKTIYICEGAFDAMTVENGCAVNCSNLLVFDKSIGDKLIKFLNCVYVLDNDRRNPEIIKSLKVLIDKNKKVMIWPVDCDSKDLNQLKTDCNDININNFINNNSYQGLQAKLMFNKWKKI
jgi:hypothetical protein